MSLRSLSIFLSLNTQTSRRLLAVLLVDGAEDRRIVRSQYADVESVVVALTQILSLSRRLCVVGSSSSSRGSSAVVVHRRV